MSCCQLNACCRLGQQYTSKISALIKIGPEGGLGTATSAKGVVPKADQPLAEMRLWRRARTRQ
ncbi:MAG: hypothetical protein A3A24_03270 [Candidatus Buchananbacteria bacterium RIFCSPLOWO2_01_FULL_46_12]|uniref:Uncharacterized protein n=2 Tax=Candidatus Buchananiibacteriota TaxID=1817903 RepID=A0A1G1YRK6_9BACT|nr:MAG: hypothetical protein A2744_00755 [Candidatus Buchananbacteria bacterium RIFCSPHIGHO2_01_FULL_44_11]OGY54919.1 MAG: hypothetical protein A3A24_03270 [Candidatus Buchananbacteria bacterium RIFCSPLOWO2_01_FULL_46_12]